MEGFLSMIFLDVFCVPAAPLANRGGLSGGGIRTREREAVRLSATEAHEQPMPNKDEAWATESRRFLRGCRKQSGADGVAAELAKARTEDGSGPTS